MIIDNKFRQFTLHILKNYAVKILRYYTVQNVFREIVVIEKQASYHLLANFMFNLNVYCT